MATHQTNVEMTRPIPSEVEAGADVILKVKVWCPEGCDLRGIPIKVKAADEVVLSSELATHDEMINETEEFAVRVPEHVGDHAWTIQFLRHESEGGVHEESHLVMSFTTRPHITSMAVWGVPTPVVVNSRFRVKVGVKCSATCPLAGQLVEVRDAAGILIGEGTLGETPWPGTSALYVADVELAAPATEGMASWSARFTAGKPGLPHEDASVMLSFRTAGPPEHRVTVRVADHETGAPLEDVEVRLGVYRALTDEHGLAGLEVPGGVYDLNAWKVGYETLPRTLEVSGNLMIQLEALLAAEKDSEDERVWM